MLDELVVLLIAMLLSGTSVALGYLVRRAKTAVRITYAGGSPYASLTIESPRGDGSPFARDVIETLLTHAPQGREITGQANS